MSENNISLDSSLSDTKTFEKAVNDDASLYSFAGGEDCVCEFIRTPSAACSMAMRRAKWMTHKNTRFVVYAMFFVILAIYAVYYTATGMYYIGGLAGVVAAFMLYIVLFGHNYFTEGMAFDASGGEGSLCVKFCTDTVYIYDGKDLCTADYSQLVRLRQTRKYLFVKFKSVKPYSDGMVLTKSSVSAESLKTLMEHISAKQNNK